MDKAEKEMSDLAELSSSNLDIELDLHFKALSKRYESLWLNGKSEKKDKVRAIQKETYNQFDNGEKFYYFYIFENSILEGTIGEFDYKHDGGLYAFRKTKEEAELDRENFGKLTPSSSE